MAEITLTAAMRNNLLQLQQTNKLMNRTQGRIASGRKVNSALDNPTAFFQAKGLTDNAKDLAVLKDAMGQSISTIQSADKGITAITALVEQAKALANSAKSAATAAERADLATQFDDLRTQIDKLAGDATFSGKNLLSGRGVVTGGAFADDSATAEGLLTGVSAGGISRTGTDTKVGTYVFTTQQKVEAATVTVSTVGSTPASYTGNAIDLDIATAVTDGEEILFIVTNTATGAVTINTFTYADAGDNTVGEFVTAVGGFNGITVNTDFAGTDELDIVAAAGFSLQIKGSGANDGANLLGEMGITTGFKSGTDVSTTLAAVGGTLNVFVGGYSKSSSSTITVLVDSQDLVISDGTSSVRVKFADFSTDTSTGNMGTQYTATLGDLTIFLGTKGDITALTNGNSTTAAKNGATGSATGDFQIVVTNSGQTVTTNVDTTSSTTVSISNSAFGSTFNFKADDAAMVAGQTANVKVTNDTGDGENDLKVVFNAAGDASINVKAVDVTSLGLLINAAVSAFATDTNVTVAITEIDAALKTLRIAAQALSTNLSVIQTREDFTDQFINTLEEGADKLTLADGNTEATNMLMLQTRQQLGIQALSMASQSAQAVLLLFR